MKIIADGNKKSFAKDKVSKHFEYGELPSKKSEI
jgi:hypothetical protein